MLKGPASKEHGTWNKMERKEKGKNETGYLCSRSEKVNEFAKEQETFTDWEENRKRSTRSRMNVSGIIFQARYPILSLVTLYFRSVAPLANAIFILERMVTSRSETKVEESFF